MRVIHVPIDRPSHFVDFLIGERYIQSDFIIYAFHGVDRKMSVPKLGEVAYYEDQPRHDFGAKEINKYCKIKTPTMINLGCELGNQELADSFLENACQVYIGANDDIDGMSGDFFILHFFYKICKNKYSHKEAFEIARNTDSETMLFQWFQN